MKEIINLLPCLAITMSINIALGMYYKIGKTKVSFDWKVLLQGVIKALIIGLSFMGLAYVFDKVDLGSIEINPNIVMTSGIVLYVTKDLENLMKILGLKKEEVI